ncbi:PREDICTED: sphingosine 1-phosphate receptor 1-like [Gekko japonicus]|uniref:Sphingosine 1-phosphate receptor 1-like n=1 Tax=Gekko japonicus TaxID=146911 RepID=A0ABM1K7C6_GEKJA|nr:PREDICTED: sphingosine 1-phosphate receptor 1-like [Gekko japonicus]XP_015269614.1 PREDICTED: sphingosine 1-phosphate receptor 1-like [Gekko japonicus]
MESVSMESPPHWVQLYPEYHNDNIIPLHYNYTGKLYNSKYKGRLQVNAIVFLVVCAFTVAENLVVLLAIWRNKKFHAPMYYLLGNLTLSDLLAGVAYAANIVLSGPSTLRLTPLQWFLREAGVFVTLAASVLSLFAIAVERHITMVRVRLYHGDKKRRMLLLVGATWVASFALGALPLLGWNCLGCLPECSTVLPLYSKHYVLFCIVVFLVILLSIVVLYARIYCMVKFNGQRLGRLYKGVPKTSKRYMSLLRTVTTVVGTFIACWLPLFLLLLLDVACQNQACGVLYKADYFLGLAMINSLLNPVIYTLTNKDLRRAIFRLLCCLLAVAPGAEGSRAKRFGLPVLEGSTSKSDHSSHQEGPNANLSVRNGAPAASEALVSKAAA